MCAHWSACACVHVCGREVCISHASNLSSIGSQTSCHSRAQAPTVAPHCPMAPYRTPTAASPARTLKSALPAPGTRRVTRVRASVPGAGKASRAAVKCSKQIFLKLSHGGLELRALGPSKSWDLPFLSPACSLYRNGNLPLRPHCLWDSGLHSCGVFTGVIPSATSLPHPPLPASVFGKLPFLGGGLGAS